MIKAMKFSTLCLLVFLSITSCKKSDNSSTSSNPGTSPYTTETVDQQKTDLTTECQNISNGVQGMINVNAISVLEHFVSLSGGESSQSARLIKPLTAISEQNGNVNEAVESINLSSDTTLTQLFNSIKYTFTWNPGTQQFDTVKNSSDIVFNFPSKSGGTTNDAQLTIQYTGVKAVSLISGYNGDYPGSFSITLNVSNSTVAEFSSTASYSSSGIPSSVSGFILLSPYKLQASWTYTTTSVVMTFSFLNGTNTLAQFSGTNTGNFSKTTIDTATLVQSILQTANTTFQFGNIAWAGSVNYTDIGKKLPGIESGTNPDSVATQEARLLNNDASLILYYVSSNQKIATIVAVPVENLNGISTSWGMELEFVFADKSKGTFDSYYGAGFSSSLAKIFQGITFNSSN